MMGDDMNKTRLDRGEDYPEVVEGSANNPGKLEGDTSSVVMGQDLSFEERGYGEAEKTLVDRLPAGTLRCLGLRGGGMY